VVVPVTPSKNFRINLVGNVDNANVTLYFNGLELAPKADGSYVGTYGTYTLEVGKAGYRAYHATYNIADDTEGDQTFAYTLTAAEGNVWDGKTLTEPQLVDNVYQIATPAELAWFANNVSTDGKVSTNAVVTADIDLGDYSWATTIGNKSNPYRGVFDGGLHTISGLYINNSTLEYAGLFGYTNSATVKGVIVDGYVSAKQYVAGVIGYAYSSTKIDSCFNHAQVTAAGTYAAGITGRFVGSFIHNCGNTGDITGTTYCAGLVGYHSATADIANGYSVGTITGTSTAACLGGTASKTNASNIFAVSEYDITDGHTLVTLEQMASGEVAYKLGEAFGQEIGVDPYPVLGGMKVYYNASTDTYSNSTATSLDALPASTDAELTGVYDLQGRRLTAPQQGVNILRYSDGSVRKVMIR
jgi:hypothetical protein